MNTKLVCFFLLVSVIVAMAMPFEENEDDYNLFEQLMEKRGRGRGRGRGKGGKGEGPDIILCPTNKRCFCALKSNGEYTDALTCMPSDINVGI